MPTLGEYFSDDVKKKYAEQNIAVGSVIKCFVKKTNPPKEKRFVVLGIDKSGNLVGVVFVNTEINWKIHNTLELSQLQLYVLKEENDYLEWDSYIDCSDVTELSKQDIVEAIVNKPANVLGNISKETLTQIFEFVKQSPKVTPKILKKYNL